MEKLTLFITENAHLAHWFIFGSILLAGFNIPISADLMILAAAILAANVIPENAPLLFCSVLFGCYFSAWIAYWVGRILGPKIAKWRLFRTILAEEKIQKIRLFYEKHGLLTLLLGRFIPFGVRNAIFMSTGMSRISFLKFAVRDALACSVFCTAAFSLFFFTSQNYELLYKYVKMFNKTIFALFSVATIGFIWYKRRKKLVNVKPF